MIMIIRQLKFQIVRYGQNIEKNRKFNVPFILRGTD